MMPVVGALRSRARRATCRSRHHRSAIEIFIREIYSTRRKQVIRLIISEGPRFPAMAEFYYREVLSRMLRRCARGWRRALERGEIADER